MVSSKGIIILSLANIALLKAYEPWFKPPFLKVVNGDQGCYTLWTLRAADLGSLSGLKADFNT